MVAGRNIEFGEPIRRDIAASGLSIFADVAGNIGQLKGKAQIIGTAQRFGIIGSNAHDDSHHQPHNTCDMIAIKQ